MAQKKARKAESSSQRGKAQKKKAAGQAARAATRSEEVSGIQAFIKYLKEVRVEFEKITWATKKETIGVTVAVLAITFFFAAYLGLVDFSLTKILGLLY
ncbi:MAG TPA: preprotein translocase subunit SecE [Dissulfuribacter thermophilus]|uniref:Protein translocase subunit SecE n=1 Tax=Dissulfuribacter thermophilus TaxID=1156395 RepID=A0A7V2SVB8_9BACT|nr:preprotein translocase subunit SecE [Dissulfuribacter thermophilus]